MNGLTQFPASLVNFGGGMQVRAGAGGVALPYAPDYDYDAARLSLANNDPVTSFTDFGANGKHATQADAAKQPTFIASSANLGNRPVVRFDGVNDALLTASLFDSTWNKAFTCFVVSAGHPNSGTNVYMSAGTKVYAGREQNQNIQVFPGLSTIKQGYSKQSSYNSGYAVWIDGFACDGVTHKNISNGNLKSQSMTANIGLTNEALTIGAYNTGTLSHTWDIARVLLWKRAMTEAEVRQVASYLASQYSIPLCTRRIICAGDSLTAGYYATAPGGAWPEQLKAGAGSPNWYIFNFAQSGKTLANAITEASSTVDLCHVSGVDEYFLAWLGTNDLHNNLKDGAPLAADYATYLAARKTAGAGTTFAFTILPRSDGTAADFETERQNFNSAVRADFTTATSDPRVWLPRAGVTYADVLVDVAADNRIGDAGDENNATYYYDKVHMVDAGYAIVAEIIDAAISAL